MINKAILTYEEQVKYHMPPINIEYLIKYPEDIKYVGDKYLNEHYFRNRVMEYMSLDPVFKAQCNKLLSDYIEEYERRESENNERRR